MIPSHLPQGQSQAFSTFPKVPAHTLTHGHTRPPSSTQYLWAVKHQQGHLEFLAYIYVQFAVGQKNMQHRLVLSLSQISERWFQADSMPPQSSVSCSWPGLLRLLLHSPVPVFLVCLCFPVWPLLFLHVSHLPVFSWLLSVKASYSTVFFYFSSELFWR